MYRYCFVVQSQPVDGREDEYNAWYDGQHVPDVLRVPGCFAARRMVSDGPDGRRYLAIYEIEAEDGEDVVKEIRRRARTDAMPMSSALDTSRSSGTLYKLR
jgi:hypothetical protein